MEKILRKITPSAKEREKLETISKKLTAEIKKETEKIDSRIQVMLLGSASRDTWLRYEKDLDIFALFPPEYEKGELERVVTKIAKKILKKPEKRYAEHPYIRGVYEDFEIEIVPCYATESAAEIKSAVDRTPLHDAFVRRYIKGRENEVRLLKQFLKGIDCYGAEAKVGGISGYLCELLVIKYGSFKSVLDAAKGWKRGEVIQIDNALDVKKIREKFNSPLIFIDPVDANRNVASALSEQKFSEFIFGAKEFLRKSSEKFFFPQKKKIAKKEILKKFRQRGTEIMAIVFEKPDVIEDILYPQLKKTLNVLENLLSGRDFHIVGTNFFVQNRVCIFIELESVEIPNAKLHFGPKVNSEHEERFLKKYENYKEKLTEPFISGKIWCIFLKRKYTNAAQLLKKFLSRKNLEQDGIPSYIAKSLARFEIRINENGFLKEFLADLQNYFYPRFAWE